MDKLLVRNLYRYDPLIPSCPLGPAAGPNPPLAALLALEYGGENEDHADFEERIIHYFHYDIESPPYYLFNYSPIFNECPFRNPQDPMIPWSNEESTKAGFARRLGMGRLGQLVMKAKPRKWINKYFVMCFKPSTSNY